MNVVKVGDLVRWGDFPNEYQVWSLHPKRGWVWIVKTVIGSVPIEAKVTSLTVITDAAQPSKTRGGHNRDEIARDYWEWAWSGVDRHNRVPFEESASYKVTDWFIARLGDSTHEFHVRSNAPDTSKAIVDKVRTGSLQSILLSQYVIEGQAHGGGFTDDELEQRLGRTHQSLSATRNHLMKKGYLADSGVRRPTRSGNPAIVYVWTGKEVQR